MIFYAFIMILVLFLIDHFYLYFTKKPKKKKKKKDKKIFIEDDILMNSKDDIAVDDPLQYMDMGYYYEINKMPKEAIKYYEKAIEHGVKKQVIYYFLYRMYKEEKMHDELISLGNDVLAKNPYDLVVNESLAYFYQDEERQDIEKACYHYSQVKKIEKINSMMLSAHKEEEAKKIDQAVKRYKEVISFDSRYSQAYKKLADLYRKNGKINLAISNYKRAVKMDPQDVYSKLWLGIILGMRGRKKEAQILLNEVIAIDSKDDNAQLAAYTIYYLESNAKEKDDTFKVMFEDELNKTISLFEKEAYENPLDHKVYWKLGMVYFVQEMLEEMKQKFEKVININPSSIEAKFAWCLLNSSFLLN